MVCAIDPSRPARLLAVASCLTVPSLCCIAVAQLRFSSRSPLSVMSAAAAAAPSTDVITLSSLVISPSGPVPIDAGLTLTFAFDSTIPMDEAHWDFKYVVDSASKRHVIEVSMDTREPKKRLHVG